MMSRPSDDSASVLPDQTTDDTDSGWGESSYGDSDRDPDVDRLTAERPPHYDDRA